MSLTPATISHWCDGKLFAGDSGNTATVTNPATGEVTGQVALASVADAQLVIDSAAAAFPAWRDTSLAKRTAILFNFRELLNKRKHELAALITAEHGKVLSDALGEVGRGQEVVEFACNIPYLLKGGFTENASTGVDVHSVRQPLGVVGVISPFNFPAMVPMWFFPIAIATGNTVVVKPSEKDPSSALWMAELWKEAGLPDGVFNVLQGDKTAVDELLTNPKVRSISFVGSTPIAQYVYATGTAAGKRVQALGGAKNHANLAAHTTVWPEMLDTLREAGWHNYSLFLRERDGMVVGYLETDDFARATARMEATAVNDRWQATMAGYFAPAEPGDSGANPDTVRDQLTEYFHLD